MCFRFGTRVSQFPLFLCVDCGFLVVRWVEWVGEGGG